MKKQLLKSLRLLSDSVEKSILTDNYAEQLAAAPRGDYNAFEWVKKIEISSPRGFSFGTYFNVAGCQVSASHVFDNAPLPPEWQNIIKSPEHDIIINAPNGIKALTEVVKPWDDAGEFYGVSYVPKGRMPVVERLYNYTTGIDPEYGEGHELLTLKDGASPIIQGQSGGVVCIKKDNVFHPVGVLVGTSTTAVQRDGDVDGKEQWAIATRLHDFLDKIKKEQ